MRTILEALAWVALAVVGVPIAVYYGRSWREVVTALDELGEAVAPPEADVHMESVL